MEEGASLIPTSGISNGQIWRLWGPVGIQRVSTFEETFSRQCLRSRVAFSSLFYEVVIRRRFIPLGSRA